MATKKTKDTAKKETSPAETANGKASGENVEVAAPGIQIHAQYVKDFSFENPNSPESLLSNWGAPETNVQINIRHRPIKENIHEVLLVFRVQADNKEQKKTSFIIELAYGCTVSLNGVPEENQQAVLMIEVPKLLFPFAREIMAKASIQGGYPPLYLQPINFEAIYVAEAKRQKEEKDNGSDKEKASA
ncbi:MAG: protein-export chaperone SecB [Gammaproteobacteria bacterium]|nr:protein-export chaperone SecB [Gammaproteobacteria bacterium]